VAQQSPSWPGREEGPSLLEPQVQLFSSLAHMVTCIMLGFEGVTGVTS
jgi:hypothetical protein